MNDLSGFQSFLHEAVELKDELHDYQREQFDGWSRLTLAAIDDRSQALRCAENMLCACSVRVNLIPVLLFVFNLNNLLF